MVRLLRLIFERRSKEIKYVDYLYYHDRKSLKTKAIDECTVGRN